MPSTAAGTTSSARSIGGNSEMAFRSTSIAPSAAKNPATSPSAASSVVSRRKIQSTCTERAPSAIRTPISRVRRVTA